LWNFPVCQVKHAAARKGHHILTACGVKDIPFTAQFGNHGRCCTTSDIPRRLNLRQEALTGRAMDNTPSTGATAGDEDAEERISRFISVFGIGELAEQILLPLREALRSDLEESRASLDSLRGPDPYTTGFEYCARLDQGQRRLSAHAFRFFVDLRTLSKCLCHTMCWKVNFKDCEWLKIQTSAKGHLSAYIYPVVLVPFDLYRLRLKHVPIIA
jgi:hypothetical protein